MTDGAVALADLEAQLEDHRAELTGLCYRMLGSPFEAEDAVQETMVRAWRALGRFEGRAALRTWLFGIATNVCLDLLNARRRRALPMDLSSPASPDAPMGEPLPEAQWLGPIPGGDPGDVAVAREGLRLAFVAALQHLTPRQRAVLILRDVFRWKAEEVADLLETSTTSVHSLVRRARAVLASVDPSGLDTPAPDAEAWALVDRYVAAFERFDVDAIVALLHQDVTLAMPPYAFWLRGVRDVRAWLDTVDPVCRMPRQLTIVANGAPAVAMYRPTGPDGALEPFGIQVLELAGGRITGIHAFLDPALFPLFGLPATLD